MKQEIELAVVVQDGVIQKIGVSQVMQPGIRFNGKGIRWFPDQMKGRKRLPVPDDSCQYFEIGQR